MAIERHYTSAYLPLPAEDRRWPGAGNLCRHDYEDVAASYIVRRYRNHLPQFRAVIQHELAPAISFHAIAGCRVWSTSGRRRAVSEMISRQACEGIDRAQVVAESFIVEARRITQKAATRLTSSMEDRADQSP